MPTARRSTGYTVQGGGVSQDCPGSADLLRHRRSRARPAVRLRGHRDERGGLVESVAAVGGDRARRRPGAARRAAVQYVQRGTLRVDWTPPAGDFTPVTGSAVQVLRNGAPAQVIEGAASPLMLDGLDSAAAYSFQVRASNRAGTRRLVGRRPRPSSRPVCRRAPTGLTADFVYDGARRTVDIRWAAPQDDGGEPVQGYRLLINDVETATGRSGFPRGLGGHRPRATDLGHGARAQRPGRGPGGRAGDGRALRAAVGGRPASP